MNFFKLSNTKFHKNPFVGSRAVTGQKDMERLILAFVGLLVVKAPKEENKLKNILKSKSIDLFAFYYTESIGPINIPALFIGKSKF
jgi:hypothetical protein